MRIAWITDIHLTYVPPAARQSFFASLAASQLDALMLGGDIGEADSVCEFLGEIEDALQIPIYFVLGNHDYHRGSIARTRAAVSRKASASHWLRWLSEQPVVPLSATTALVGHDCWGDGRAGDFFGAEVIMSDFQRIEELLSPNKHKLLSRLHALGDEAAAVLGSRTVEAFASHQAVIVLTHVPPFCDPSGREGRIQDEALPFYVCKAVGDRLMEIAQAHPDRSLTVFSGHTHTAGTIQVLPNLVARTGSAKYGRPEIQDIIEI